LLLLLDDFSVGAYKLLLVSVLCMCGNWKPSVCWLFEHFPFVFSIFEQICKAQLIV